MPAYSTKEGASPLFAMNPAVKLAVFVVLIQTVSLSAGLLPNIAFGVLTILLIVAAKADAAFLVKRLKPFIVLIIITFVFNLMSSPLEHSASLSYRFFLIILLSVLLTATSDTKELVSAMLLPFRGKTADNIRVVCMVALEFIPTFIDESKNVSANIRQNPLYAKQPYKILMKPELFIAPLMNVLAEKSYETAKAVEAGAYTSAKIQTPSASEYILLFATAAAAAVYAVY
jgi:energy-coupling factor transporter transmembrane protein EcfT